MAFHAIAPGERHGRYVQPNAAGGVPGDRVARPVPFAVAAIDNTIGSATSPVNRHRHRRDPEDWEGFRFAIPFEFRAYTDRLRLCFANHGLDPDHDVTLGVVPPAGRIACLRVRVVDGFLGAARRAECRSGPDAGCADAAVDSLPKPRARLRTLPGYHAPWDDILDLLSAGGQTLAGTRPASRTPKPCRRPVR